MMEASMLSEAGIERMRRFLGFVARRFVRDPDEVQDLVQDTLYRMVRNYHQYEPENSLENWGAKILRNRYIELYRSRKRKHVESLDSMMEDKPWFDFPDPSPSLEETMLEDLDRVQARFLLTSLPEKFRSVAHRHYLEGKSCEQIAEEMGLEDCTVRTRLWRARTQMRARQDAFERRADRELAPS